MQGKRRDIQGLRALAVLLVIANHLIGWPGGGFIGVDVFFVLSGYLISSLLLREHARSGRISLSKFYVRRIRRILPAALTVTAMTVLVAYVLFTFGRFQSTLVDAFWATLFAANWRMISAGTDYMHATDALSPLQHFWSLSIEEQYYFVWPVVLVVLLALASARQRNFLLAVVLGFITISSFLWAMWETSSQPTWAYFSTLSRVWELSTGAFIAVLAPRVRIHERVRPALAWFGLIVIAGGAMFLTSESPFPGPYALVPVVGASAIILAGVQSQPRLLWPLTNRVSNYVGDISYSLYLWHLPVIVFTGIFLEATPRRFAVVALLLIFSLAVVSFHLIENPIRLRVPRKRIWKPTVAILATAAACLLLTTVIPVPSTEAVQTAPRVYAPTIEGDMQREVDVALNSDQWPSLEPSIDELGPEFLAPEWIEDGCLGADIGSISDPIENTERCVYGAGDKLAVVLGDSVAISWVPGIRAALEPHGYRVEVITLHGCPTASVIVTPQEAGEDPAQCTQFMEWARERISVVKPDLAITSEASWSITRLVTKAEGADAESEWTRGQIQTLTELSESAGRVVALQDPPMGFDGIGFGTCAGKGSSPSDCLLYLAPFAGVMDSANRSAAAAVPATTYIQTRQWFCSPDNLCPAFVGTTPVLVDGAHLTAARSTELAGVLESVLLGR